jgi:8-oxo-dGTP pyrophosphatase MutT (NUDIX family)
MNEYVICFAHPLPHIFWPNVLLIEKKKPAWQSGRYNLPGGKIEPNETIYSAASRELKEEAGIECPVDQIHVLGSIEGSDFIVYVCCCNYDSSEKQNIAVSLTSEQVFWLPWSKAISHPKLINNLRLIIPLCQSNLTGWKILSENDKDSVYLIQLKTDS